MERALLYVSWPWAEDLMFPGNLICYRCTEELVCSSPALPSLADVCLEVCSYCIILVENRLFLGKLRHIASLGVTDFQNAKSL